MAERFLEPNVPLKKIDNETGDTLYIYPQTTASQVKMDEDGTRLSTILTENIVYFDKEQEEAGDAIINADILGGLRKEDLVTSEKFNSLEIVEIDLDSAGSDVGNNTSIFDLVYPIGSIYTTESSTNPATLFGGTWVNTFSDYDRKNIGSIVLVNNSLTGTGLVDKQSIIGAYEWLLINGIFTSVPIPTGYHKEYRIFAQVSTANDNSVTIHLNNISTDTIRTWSGDTCRNIVATPFFKEADIIFENVYGYETSENKGLNLKYSVTGNAASAAWRITGITLSGYIASNTMQYTWKRIA